MTQQHFGCPAIISQRFKKGVFSQGQRILRAAVNTKIVVLFAVRPDAFVINRPERF